MNVFEKYLANLKENEDLSKIINKLFPYSFTGFMDACDWFDEQRATYRFARFIGGKNEES